MKTTKKVLTPKIYRDNINKNIPCVKLVMDMPEAYVTQKKFTIKDSKRFYDYIKECEFVVNAFGLYEIFGVAYLNRRNEVIGVLKIGEGGFSSTVVELKKILGGAVCCGASGMVLFHNHPSGNLTPSELDKKATKNIVDMCKIMDISVIDHVILGLDKYYSFADNYDL